MTALYPEMMASDYALFCETVRGRTTMTDLEPDAWQKDNGETIKRIVRFDNLAKGAGWESLFSTSTIQEAEETAIIFRCTDCGKRFLRWDTSGEPAYCADCEGSDFEKETGLVDKAEFKQTSDERDNQ